MHKGPAAKISNFHPANKSGPDENFPQLYRVYVTYLVVGLHSQWPCREPGQLSSSPSVEGLGP